MLLFCLDKGDGGGTAKASVIKYKDAKGLDTKVLKLGAIGALANSLMRESAGVDEILRVGKIWFVPAVPRKYRSLIWRELSCGEIVLNCWREVHLLRSSEKIQPTIDRPAVFSLGNVWKFIIKC